jgi:hypothetical protein
VHGPEFDERSFFHALASSGARILLIGRRALVAVGIPVLTADYDLWVHMEDIEALNAALAPLDLAPTCDPAVARKRGRYVLENDEHVDVLVARQQSTRDGVVVAFDDVWERRVTIPYDDEVAIVVPNMDDLIRTKMWSMRPKDIADIQLLEAKRREAGGRE